MHPAALFFIMIRCFQERGKTRRHRIMSELAFTSYFFKSALDITIFCASLVPS